MMYTPAATTNQGGLTNKDNSLLVMSVMTHFNLWCFGRRSQFRNKH